MRHNIPALAMVVMVATAMGGMFFASGPAKADPGSCTVTVEGSYCTFHCHEDDGLHIDVQNGNPGIGGVNGEAICGGLQISCSRLIGTPCTAEGEPVLVDDQSGQCWLKKGTSAFCINALG